MVFVRKHAAEAEKVAFSIDAGTEGDFDVLGGGLLVRTGASGLAEPLGQSEASRFGTE